MDSVGEREGGKIWENGIETRKISCMKKKMLHSICQQILKTQQWPQDWKRSAFIALPKKSNAKECSNYQTIEFISNDFKIMLKSFKLGFNSK